MQEIPMDESRRRQLFTKIQQILKEINAKHNQSRKFIILFMPILVIAIRRNIDIIFKCNYPLLFSSAKFNTIAMNHMTLILNSLLDPNMLYSRFSLVPPDTKAKRPKANASSRLKQIRGLIYTNSALVNSLLERRSEGKVRARFVEPRVQHDCAHTANRSASIRSKSKTLWQGADRREFEGNCGVEMYRVAFKDVNRKFSRLKLKPILSTRNE